jgi:sterol desaturase/sphingolipid hydroxylase (fatty acid hydroxylase superfamily)
MGIVAVVLATALGMMVVEALAPGRRWPQVRGWWTRVLLLNGAQVVVTLVAGRAWDGWMLRHRPWTADALGTAGGALLGYLVITFAFYWWHRWRHESGVLWRWLHQVHHSATRIEIATSFYKHPLEVLLNGVISSSVLYLGVGVGPSAAAGAVALSGLAELVYHWNVRTPHWMGYLFQRPESHCVHHQLGLHAKNYSDLPLWDMVFGTFHNPERWEAECGFGREEEQRLGAMLAGRVVAS